ncbi:porin [Caballeronia fortuita]|uniref:Porin n=1 Tax=Caballeronia fortuita TaxID=1777138 RepID=A0A158CQD2_9BURK|nr:porin [Caballeronia fortuita]SAK84555.1 porin [Caballeronia fortuita]
MRRPIAALLLLAGITHQVYAQSTVTLFGSIDNGITYVNNYGGHSVVKMQDGVNKANALGFLGSEDLGGGMRAFFKLENGFNANTGALGQGGLMFGKQAYVGLGHRTFGEITLGRQYDFTVLLERYLPCLNCGLYGVQNADFDRVSGERLNNAVQYSTPVVAGFKAGAMYAFGQNAGASSTNLGRAISANVQYTYGPFSAAVVLTDINQAPTFAGLLGTPTVLGQRVAPTALFVVDKQRILGIGASYAFASVTALALYTNTRLELAGRSSTDQVLHIGGDWHVRPDLVLAAKLSFDRFEDSRWYTATAGLDYLLSKRTDVYIDLDAQKASSPGTVASIALTAPSSTSRQFVSRIGVRHLF